MFRNSWKYLKLPPRKSSGISFAVQGGMEDLDMTFRGAEVSEAVHAGRQGDWSERRAVGRPSTVAPFAPQISEWLQAEPALTGAEVLRRVRLIGYHGGKSALYELVRRLRAPVSGDDR